MTKKKLYPKYKKIIWRYVRIFIDAFIAGLAIDQLVIGTHDIRVSVMKAAVAAGLAALAKALREGKSYESLKHKVIL